MNYIRKYIDDFYILISKVKPDNQKYIPRADPYIDEFSQPRDEFKMAIQSFESLGCRIIIRNKEDLSHELPDAVYAHEKNEIEGVQLVYHIVNLQT